MTKRKEITKEITDFLRQIDSTKFTVVFFNYSAKKKWYNIFLLATKFYYWLNNRPKIDHVAFISKWRYGEPYIFEANVKKGMIESNLVERLGHFQGNFYYKALSRFDSEIVNKYKKETEGKKYDILKAVGSAVDNVKWFTKFVDKRKAKGYFCSYSVIDLMERLSYREADQIIKKAGGDKYKVDPTEIYEFFKEKNLNKIKIMKEDAFLKSIKVMLITILFFIIFLIVYMSGLWVGLGSHAPKYQELNAFDRQTKENKILQTMANAYREDLDDEKKQNVFLSLLVTDGERNYFSFVDMIVFGGSEINSHMRNSLRSKYRILCDVTKLDLEESIEIPQKCIDGNISVSRKNLQSLYGYRLSSEYLVVMACYNIVCSTGQAKSIFQFLRQENG